MLDGPAVAAAFKDCGITDVVWIPDSDPASCSQPGSFAACRTQLAKSSSSSWSSSRISKCRSADSHHIASAPAAVSRKSPASRTRLIVAVTLT